MSSNKESHFISSPEDLNNIKVGWKIAYLCTECGKECSCIILDNKNKEMRKANLLCKTHKTKKTKLEKYGDENYTNSQKISETMLERYGVRSYTLSEEFKEKSENTKLLRYGNAKFTNSKKTKATKLKRYGDEFYSNPKKNKNTLFRKYGKLHIRSNYLYENIYFDSSWELAFYIYNKDHGNEILREPKSINFTFNNDEYNYFPDFLLNGELIEIKGDQFLKNNTFINPFDPSKNEFMKSLYQCCIDNNVKIISTKDISPYLQYVKTKYGDDYLSSFCLRKTKARHIGTKFPQRYKETPLFISEISELNNFSDRWWYEYICTKCNTKHKKCFIKQRFDKNKALVCRSCLISK